MLRVAMFWYFSPTWEVARWAGSYNTYLAPVGARPAGDFELMGQQ